VSGGPQLAIARELETADGDELSIGATGSWGITEAWNSDLYISGSRIRDNVAVPAVAAGALGGQPAFSTITRYQRAQLLWVNRVELSAKVHFVAGVDFVAEDGSDSGEVDLGFAVFPNSYELDRSVSSAFAEFGKLWDGGATTTLAVRWDHDGVEGRLSGKFGITRSVSNSGSQIWGRVANGFKLPSFFALGNPLYGNPNLVTEKVRNVEIGYTHVFDSASELELSLYTSRYDDLVDFDFESSTNVNKGRIDVSGIEVRSSYKLSPTFRLLIDGTWSNITSDSGPLRRRPERFGGVGLDWSPAQQWRINLATRYVGSRLTTSIPTGDVNASSFTIIGATVNFEPLPNRKFWIAINNALDEDYQDAPGFPSPGVRIRIGTKLDF
jgi:outer membrane cobalamin receptor